MIALALNVSVHYCMSLYVRKCDCNHDQINFNYEPKSVLNLDRCIDEVDGPANFFWRPLRLIKHQAA